MTTNIELNNIVNKLSFKNKFLGCVMRDEIKNIKCENNCWLIVNLNSVDKNDSGHWQLLWKKDNQNIFFCSFGSHIFNEAKEFLGSNILCTNFRIQEWGSSICGELAILVAYLLDNNFKFEDII